MHLLAHTLAHTHARPTLAPRVGRVTTPQASQDLDAELANYTSARGADAAEPAEAAPAEGAEEEAK